MEFFDMAFSLPTQRCFPPAGMEPPVFGLFSAYAEVFLGHKHQPDYRLTFLCLRRGVSKNTGLVGVRIYFSLPTQRCF